MSMIDVMKQEIYCVMSDDRVFMKVMRGEAVIGNVEDRNGEVMLSLYADGLRSPNIALSIPLEDINGIMDCWNFFHSGE